MSKPTWRNTFGCSATSAFFVLILANESIDAMSELPDEKEKKMTLRHFAFATFLEGRLK